MYLSNNIISINELLKFNDNINSEFLNILNKKIKLLYQFNFLCSSYIKN